MNTVCWYINDDILTVLSPSFRYIYLSCWFSDSTVLCPVGGWDEKFLQQESELKRVRSEKANLEQHILGMEAELETQQEERTRLQDEVERGRRTCSAMEQRVDALTNEVKHSERDVR